ncbi:MAG: glycoside hydrolase family 55 protein, partial [Oscillospiraceae bacterium]|nr:glycoside hydrolase family 55 protein [Oscillospiraceae bacterium]
MTKTPYILNERYPTNDLSVITAAVNYSGEEDATPIIQAAIDETAAIGGGTVYLPEGQYPLRTTLVMKTGVCLRGEWINPDVEPNNGRGTILLCYAGENDPDGPPQIGMQACTGLRNLTCFYPNQSVAAPVPYSPTVRQPGGDSITLENVTLVNPWRGVQCGPEGNELHTLKNVYMTPVSTGMFMDVTTDIGRLQNLQIKPQIWENFTLNAGDPVMTAEESTALRAHMLRGVTGVFMARSDWEYGYNIYVEHCHIGFLITSFTSGGPNAQISRLRLHNC